MRLVPYRDAGNRIEGVVVTFTDVTSLIDAEVHQRTLIAELNHRVKNMLTIAISIAEQTQKSAPSPEDFKRAFIDRLRSMARSYELLSRENWTAASIGELIRQELSPFGLDRISENGPAVRLKPRQAMSLGMVLHELATNAGKSGALSAESGHVVIRWSVTKADGVEHLEIDWHERGGPTVAEPTRRGFGLKLVEREISYNLSGHSSVAFNPDGLKATIVFPLTEESSS